MFKSEILYHDVLIAGWVTLLVLGISLLCSKVPKLAVYDSYIRSRRILGIAYIIFGICIAQFSIFNLRQTAPRVAVAWPLTYFYLCGILFAMSFISLLDKKYLSSRHVKMDLAGFAVFLIIAWTGALLGNHAVGMGLLITASIWFFVGVSIMSVRFVRIYRNAVAKINDYYSENVEAFVKWLHKSTYGIIFFGLSSSVLSFAPYWCNSIFMFCGIVMFLYIYISMQNYALNVESVQTAVAQETENELQSSDNPASDNSALRESIMKWEEQGGYREVGITLEKLAMSIGSNRSYVSSFINTEFKCNFREWINSLRIDYAKVRLLENPEMTLEKIATDSGFSSSAYFCRQFQKHAHMTPTQWRASRHEKCQTMSDIFDH